MTTNEKLNALFSAQNDLHRNRDTLLHDYLLPYFRYLANLDDTSYNTFTWTRECTPHITQQFRVSLSEKQTHKELYFGIPKPLSITLAIVPSARYRVTVNERESQFSKPESINDFGWISYDPYSPPAVIAVQMLQTIKDTSPSINGFLQALENEAQERRPMPSKQATPPAHLRVAQHG